MNYLHMLDSITITQRTAYSQCCFSQREGLFDLNLHKIAIVPTYVVLEAIFQTAGYLLQNLDQPNTAAMVASCKRFEWSRPIYANETLMIQIDHEFSHQHNHLFMVSTSINNTLIIKEGQVIMTPQPTISIEAIAQPAAPNAEIKQALVFTEFEQKHVPD